MTAWRSSVAALIAATFQGDWRTQSAPRPWVVECLARSKPIVRWPLGPLFREISGLALTADGRLLFHNDEQGVIGALDGRTGQLVATYSLGAVPPRGDFEGIATGAGTVWVVSSTGLLYQADLPARDRPSGALAFTVTATGIGEQCEIEGLAFDPRQRALLAACKNPRLRSLADQVAVFRWSIDQRRLANPDRIAFPRADLARGGRSKGFHPSSVEWDPTSGQLILIASADNAVAGGTTAGTVLGTATLGGGHSQPEGLAIGPDHTVYLADEGTKGPGTISVYRCDQGPL